jgi:hypothetical protein
MTAYTDFHYSPTGSGVISGAQVLEQTEQGINGLGQYVQDNVSGAIDTANEALTTARSADSNATTALNLANSFNAQIIAANQTAGNALTTAQSAQNTANAASSLATTADNNAATALNAANSASAGVTTLTGTVNSLGNRMTAAENAISANAGNITTLQNGLATTNANVTAAANAASAAQATATSAQSTATQARNQAYVLRYTGTTITGGGTIAYTDIDNTDNIKAGDKIIDISGAIYAIASVDTANQTVTVGASPVINLFCDAENLIPAANEAYDLGSSSYQWNNVYGKAYYYNGTEFQNKFVTLDTDQTLTGRKNYKTSYSDILPKTVNFPSATRYYVAQRDYAYNDESLTLTWGFVQSSGTNVRRWYVYPYSSGDSVYFQININADASSSEFKTNVKSVTPVTDNTTDLGTSTNKWKTLNGINPGILSLPKGDLTKNTDYFDISSSFINLGNGAVNEYTAVADGWIYLILGDINSCQITIKDSSGNQIWGVSSYGKVERVFIPILQGLKLVTEWSSSGNVNVATAKLIVCQGNV